jgi:hypothetical protein
VASVTVDRRRGLDASIAVKVPVLYASTGNLTSLAGSTQVIDGVTASSGRILVWVQNTTSENGVYDIDSTWTRALDFDSSSDVAMGSLVYVTSGGTAYGNTFFIVTSTAPKPGSTTMTFAQRTNEFVGASAFGSTFVSLASAATARDFLSAMASTAALGSTLAWGSIFTGSSNSTAESLAVGASGAQLYSSGSSVFWSTVAYFAGSFTHAASSSGTQAVTGVGFKPKCVFFLANISGGVGKASWGFDTTAAALTLADYGATSTGLYSPLGTGSINMVHATTLQTAANIQSMDADGYTLNWTITGIPTGTVTAYYLAMR